MVVHPLTIVDRGVGGGVGNCAAVDGWRFEVRDPSGAVYRAGNRKACERWVRARDEWVKRGRPFDYKSKYLDYVEGQLVFDGGGSSYGITYREDQ